jgi:tRNA 2-thiouridine synthesizing protein A
VTTLDARGLSCPLPLLLARRRMTELRGGDTLLVLATDPEAPLDLAAWAAEEGHSFRERGGDLTAEPPAGGWLELELRKAG